jgi:ribosome-associated protein
VSELSNVKSAPLQYRRADLPGALQLALDVAIDKNARAPRILQVTDITGYTDWVLIVSGRSDRHVQAIAEGITAALRDAGHRPLGVDGFGDNSWNLLDFDEFMIHVFYHPVRMHYDLESMWADAPVVDLALPPQVMDTSDLDTLRAPSKLPAFRGDIMFGGFDDEFEDEDDEHEHDDEPEHDNENN